MPYESPADFCAKFAIERGGRDAGFFDARSVLDRVTVVGETTDTARVEATWYTSGHDPESGYWDVFERAAFVLVKRVDGWHLNSEEDLGYE
ncbi:hypothetical protein [Plantactinospora soyae]|uniref:Uncharacterized protein n=1 Tax=Plantactinospora soyae TaxID=1544732 RepID=A0A927M7Z6_9ACTN|nr:hypothetical protein [Plantactinospora soyae]MBE1488585.1 hypothetical protein [Plantactinospora soyae]